MRRVKVPGISAVDTKARSSKTVDTEVQEYQTVTSVLDTVLEYMRIVTTEIEKLQARCDSLESHVSDLVKKKRSPNK